MAAAKDKDQRILRILGMLRDEEPALADDAEAMAPEATYLSPSAQAKRDRLRARAASARPPGPAGAVPPSLTPGAPPA